MHDIRRRTLLQGGLALGATLAAPAVLAQQKTKLKMASLTLPVFSPIVVAIMQSQGFDAKHGMEIEGQPDPSLAAYYAGLATGENETLLGGPTNFQKLRSEGVPVRIVATGAKLSDLVVITSDPKIKTLADLRGKQLAADMGAAQFHVLSICAKAKGIELGKDINLVNANFAVARAQLAAGRVEAALVIEPIATLMLKENPKLGIVFNGNEGWKELTGHEGWELVYAVREEALKRPDLVPKFIAVLRDVADYMRTQTDAADRIVVEKVKLPPGVLAEAVRTKRWDFEIRPAWEADRKVIWDMFERAVAAGFHAKMPDKAIIYVP
ncbi:MAG: ABC transporter substrate-binding protein [Variibacter sp.]|nr:ABC transporter substrate-binding protein [Variibacter sp.]